MSSNVTDTRHPDFKDLWITTHIESQTMYIGTILLYEELDSYKTSQWYMCLINPLDSSDYKKHKWGSQSDSDRLEQMYTKPMVYTGPKTFNEWFLQWQRIHYDKLSTLLKREKELKGNHEIDKAIQLCDSMTHKINKLTGVPKSMLADKPNNKGTK